MLAFLDFEASSLAKRSYPIEVAWVFEDGRCETHLIRPASGWTDWDEEAQAIHGITREQLARDGRPHVEIAHHIVAALSGHDLCASAPSWDGKWLSALLRSADFPRHTLRLRDTDDVMRETAERILRPVIADEQLDEAVDTVITLAAVSAPGTAPVHRALPDAQAERARWLRVRDAAQARAADAGSPEQ